ncbi:MAG TPA: dipeptide epimerase [Candidatus Saccharimonadales bacterium]|nr:dipeptide epimerase [Candidatus Saccharimonadales bacterium]
MMNRRNWLKFAGAAGLSAALPSGLNAMEAPTSGKAEVRAELKRLTLRHAWTTTMSSSAYRDTVHVQYKRDGITGYGEGAPIVRYKEYPDQAKQAIDAISDRIALGDPRKFDKFLADIRHSLGANQHAAMAAVDIAVSDWIGKKLGIPLYEYFGLDPADAPLTTFSIGIDTPEITRQKTREAEDFPVLKVKVGLKNDEETIEAVRSVTRKPIRVDANEGWTDKEEAIRKINWLETQGVEFIEQPMPAHMFDEIKYVRSKVHMPIIADEACADTSMIPRLKEAYDGINVKLDKSGGIMEAYRWIKLARAMDMKVMLGCMISSSCSCTAAAQLSPLVDYADLDGSLLIANDPYEGVRVNKGKLILPTGPGLGMKILPS